MVIICNNKGEKEVKSKKFLKNIGKTNGIRRNYRP